MRPLVLFKRLDSGEGLDVPNYKTADAAGIDLPAAIDEPLTLNPGDIKLVPQGFAVEIPKGYEGQVRPRSGLALKGISIVNAPGTVDADFRGELKTILINLGRQPVTFYRGDRIAQMVIAPVAQASIGEAAKLSETERGTGGHGSTGLR